MRIKAPQYDLFKPTSEISSRIKKRVRSKNTSAELMLRRHIWKLGLRYRIHVGDLPGKPDIVFPSARVVVFCDGDFWHGRNWEQQKAALRRRNNPDYWIPKIESNIERDIIHTKILKRMGWRVIRLWETDILRHPKSSAKRVFNVVRKL